MQFANLRVLLVELGPQGFSADSLLAQQFRQGVNCAAEFLDVTPVVLGWQLAILRHWRELTGCATRRESGEYGPFAIVRFPRMTRSREIE